MPTSVFAKNKLFVDITSTSTSQWLSDDLSKSDLMNDTAINELCETLSPLQLNYDKNKNRKGISEFFENNKLNILTFAETNNKLKRKILNKNIPSPLAKHSIFASSLTDSPVTPLNIQQKKKLKNNVLLKNDSRKLLKNKNVTMFSNKTCFKKENATKLSEFDNGNDYDATLDRSLEGYN